MYASVNYDAMLTPTSVLHAESMHRLKMCALLLVKEEAS